MNLKYMKVSLFEISYKKNELFHDILIYWDAPVSLCLFCVAVHLWGDDLDGSHEAISNDGHTQEQ